MSDVVSNLIPPVEYISYRVEYYPIINYCCNITNPTILSIHPHTASRINHYWQQFKILPNFSVEYISDVIYNSIPPVEYISYRVEYYPIINFCWSIINPTILGIQPHTASIINWLFIFFFFIVFILLLLPIYSIYWNNMTMMMSLLLSFWQANNPTTIVFFFFIVFIYFFPSVRIALLLN